MLSATELLHTGLRPTGSRYLEVADPHSDWDYFGAANEVMFDWLSANGFHLKSKEKDDPAGIGPVEGYNCTHCVWERKNPDGSVDHVLLWSSVGWALYDLANRTIYSMPKEYREDKELRVKLFKLLTGRL
jgi:hypothetical protein